MKCRLLGLTKYAVIFCGLAAMGVGEASADVRLQETYSTYQLRGLTPEAMHADLHRVAKRDRDGLIDGEVGEDLHWTLRLVEAENSCQVSSDDIVLKLNILLPTWVDQERADPAVRSLWNHYYQQLKAHEDTHRKIAIDGAERISKLTHGATARGPCRALERTLNDAANQIVEDTGKAQDEHDANAEPFDLEQR
ncbi:MAG: DUF922 domain-containing protein [Mesorhizobium sp.]|uniref:DUF922 domain-containing protein n=1 Tax=Mesorhizobium sp. TaxID=1871066 RepID=UPI000FEA1D2D|nr:DUF922 domain-containing protein [Mesorhizobium sp.]RWC00245.1 MAG: DUF922 domain-containing protein [Mesorhizobium sp.]